MPGRVGDAVLVDLRTGPALVHALVSTLGNFREVLTEQWVVHAQISADANHSPHVFKVECARLSRTNRHRQSR